MDDNYWDSMDDMFKGGFKAKFCYMAQKTYDKISNFPSAVRFIRKYKLQIRVNEYIAPNQIVFTNDVLGGTRRKI